MRTRVLIMTVSTALVGGLAGEAAAQTAANDEAVAEANEPVAVEEAAASGPKRLRAPRFAGGAPARSPVPVARPEGPVEAALLDHATDTGAATAGPRRFARSLVERALEAEDAEMDGDKIVEAAIAEDTSDLPEIRDRGFLRLAVAPDPLLIAYDGERAIGVAMDLAQELEKYLAERHGEGTPTVVVPMPVPRRLIAEAVDEGHSDFTPLVVSEAPEEEFDFTRPLLTDVSDVVVLGPDAPEVDSLEDLTDVRLYVSEGGRYAADLKAFNEARADLGLEPLEVRYVDERLDDYDLIEMVEIGLIPATVMTDFKADFWSQIYTSVDVRHDLELTPDQSIAWAVRDENPKLREALDGFAERVKKGTLIGNVLMKRYLGGSEWIKNLDDDEARALIAEVEPVIQEYSGIYGFESDLVLAQAYQESGLDQTKRSHAGAVGVMQVMPATAADPVVAIPNVTDLESNVQAGIKYLRWLRDTYYSEPEIAPLDRTLLSFAAYNAGPGGVQRARALAEEIGLDPNVWFENVEVAITRAVSREPAVYVRNIFKYYVSYRLMHELEAEREAAWKTLADVEQRVGNLPLEKRIEALEKAEMVTEEGETAVEPSSVPPAVGPSAERAERISP